MKERSEIISWIRGELVGPAIPLSEADEIEFTDLVFVDSEKFRQGPLAWRPTPESDPEEVLYYEHESPHRKYGSGRLHPEGEPDSADEAALRESDSIGAEPESDESVAGVSTENGQESDSEIELAEGGTETDDFEVTSADERRPSTMGISFCARLARGSKVLVQIPQYRRFSWQTTLEKTVSSKRQV